MSVVAFLLGLLVVVQLRAQAGDVTLANLSSQDLTMLVATLNTGNDKLRSEIASLERQLETLEFGGSRGASSIDEIRADLARIRAWSGLDPVAGDGVTITVNGPIGASAMEDLLNELRNAGAEAIAVEEVRIVPGSTIGGSPGSLAVDDVALGDPFAIRAIGTPESLIGSLTRIGGIMAQIAGADVGVTLDVQASDRLLLPATTRDLVPSHGHPRL